MAEDDPFKPEDLDNILKLESSSDEAEGWHFVKRTETAELWKKDVENSSIKVIKALLQFPGIPVADVLELLYNLDVRRRWDKIFSVIELIEERPKYKILYWLYKMPIGVSDRDIIQHGTMRTDEEKNLHYILYRNATDDRKPEISGIVRAKTILSGVLIRPQDGDPNSTKLTLLMQNDPMGLIPSFATNILASKAPLDWQDNLTKFYHEVYVKEKN